MCKTKLLTSLDNLNDDIRATNIQIKELNINQIGKQNTDPKYQEKLTYLKDVLSELITQQASIKTQLSELKVNMKSFNKVKNVIHKTGFSDAFVMAAEQLLTEDQFLNVEMKAAQIIENLK